ncbi:hypothetical protein [Nitrosomonas sp.]|uniref:hypothetical protein n=1 Tax=Nitrosomonas sp. TaxID=42353 RepID=UPI00208844F9|nr:hypothetical protein [Nitrosomonas sp.]GJL74480.1 MAG: hypothetical protein NMNS02_05860 [Nitrosomonas sp.]
MAISIYSLNIPNDRNAQQPRRPILPDHPVINTQSEIDTLSFCRESLEGSYKLDQKYFFHENQEKETRTSLPPDYSIFKNATCERDGKNTKLEGYVSTLFTLEVKINNKYKPIAYIFYNYTSTITIDQNKKFLHRYFSDLIQKYTEGDLASVIHESEKFCPKTNRELPTMVKELGRGQQRICRNNKIPLEQKEFITLINTAIDEYKKAFSYNKDRLPCGVTYGEIGKERKPTFAFICEGYTRDEGYTRVMKKI